MVSKDMTQMIPKIQRYLAGQPVEKAWLFGSCSRGEEHADSDVDILVRYQSDSLITLFTISRIMRSLSKILNRRVDLVEDGCVLPFAQKSIDQDRILIYERES